MKINSALLPTYSWTDVYSYNSSHSFDIKKMKIANITILWFHFESFGVYNIGEGIATINLTTHSDLQHSYTRRIEVGGDFNNNTGRTSVDIDFDTEGRIIAYPQINQMSGTLSPGVNIFGDGYMIFNS